jgi:hypothetical protein
MNKSQPPRILEDYIQRRAFADEIDVCQETLIRWERDGHGPPVTYIGRTPYYYRPSATAWLRAQEKTPAA